MYRVFTQNFVENWAYRRRHIRKFKVLIQVSISVIIYFNTLDCHEFTIIYSNTLDCQAACLIWEGIPWLQTFIRETIGARSLSRIHKSNFCMHACTLMYTNIPQHTMNALVSLFVLARCLDISLMMPISHHLLFLQEMVQTVAFDILHTKIKKKNMHEETFSMQTIRAKMD